MTETGVIVFDQTHVVVIYFIGGFSGEFRRQMGDQLLIDANHQIGFPVDEAEIVRNGDNGHPFAQLIQN